MTKLVFRRFIFKTALLGFCKFIGSNYIKLLFPSQRLFEEFRIICYCELLWCDADRHQTLFKNVFQKINKKMAYWWTTTLDKGPGPGTLDPRTRTQDPKLKEMYYKNQIIKQIIKFIFIKFGTKILPDKFFMIQMQVSQLLEIFYPENTKNKMA